MVSCPFTFFSFIQYIIYGKISALFEQGIKIIQSIKCQRYLKQL